MVTRDEALQNAAEIYADALIRIEVERQLREAGQPVESMAAAS